MQISIFQRHNVCSTESLKAKGNGENISEILVAGGWANTKIFWKYYDWKIIEKFVSDFIICEGGFVMFKRNYHLSENQTWFWSLLFSNIFLNKHCKFSFSVKSLWKQTVSKIKYLQLKKTLQLQLWLELYFWNRKRILELSLPFHPRKIAKNEFKMDVRSSDYHYFLISFLLQLHGVGCNPVLKIKY